MLALEIALTVLLTLVFFLLLNPFQLCLDTTRGDYYLGWRGIGSARLSGEPEDPLLRLWLMGWRKRIHLADLIGASRNKKEKPPKHPRKAGRKRPGWFTWRLALRLLRTFRVQRFWLLLDTGDYVMNAYLFSLFSGLSGGGRRLQINFDGRTELVLIVTNRLWDVMRVFITGIFKSKK